MSAVTVWTGRAWNCGHVQDLSVSPPCRIENVQCGSGVCDLGPADAPEALGHVLTRQHPALVVSPGAAQVAEPRETGPLIAGLLLIFGWAWTEC